MKPLTDSQMWRIVAKITQRQLGSSVFPNQSHIEMPVIRRAFCFAMACRCRPCSWKVIQAVPVNPFGLAYQKFRRSLESEYLNLFCAKGRSPYFCDPYRQVGYGADLVELRGPFMNSPVIPVQGKTMHGNDVYMGQHGLTLQILKKARVDGRH